MQPVLAARFPADSEAAAEEQRRLRALLSVEAPRTPVASWAGLAAQVVGTRCRAAVVITGPEGRTDTCFAEAAAPAAYRPGLFAFAVGPAVLAALGRITQATEVLFCLGHGMAHPQRLGLAAHVGVLYDLPTIGCADRLLCGEFASVPDQRGAWTPITEQGEIVGAAVRTRRGARPLLVSPGHRMNLELAVSLTLAAATESRWPQPLRQARHLLRQAGAA